MAVHQHRTDRRHAGLGHAGLVVTRLAAAALGFALSGCGGSPLPATLGVAVGSTVHPEPPVEIYSRIARGALSCWFGANGNLKKTHIFNADVPPGGAAEIVIHERDGVAPSPRSLRSYRITISPSGEGSHVAIENLKFPEPMATDLKADVVRWAGGRSDCSVVGVGGWNAAPTKGDPPPKAAPKPKLVKKKQ